MVEVDARGLSCPEPIMLTAEALKNEKGPIKVLVSEPVQKENVENMQRVRERNQHQRKLGTSLKSSLNKIPDLGIRRIWKFRSSRENGCFFAYIFAHILHISCT